LRRRHAAFFLDLAERLEPESRGLQSGPWLNRLEADHDNLRAALRWAIDRGQAETALRLTWALGMFWFKGGHWSEARRWLAEALLLDGPVPPAVRARALALDGNFAKHQEDLVAAQGRTEQALALYRQLGDTHAVARTLRNLGEIAAIQGDFARARVLSEECLALARQIRDVELITQCFSNLGLAALFAGDFAQGVPFYEEALRLARQGANTFGIGLNLIYLGQAALWQDEIALARGRFTESLAIWRELGHRDQIALCLNGLGGVAAAERQPGRAARLWGAAEALREALGAMLEPLEKRLLERDIARGRALASRPAFEAAWATGRAMPMEEAIQYVLGSAEPEPVESSAEDLVLLTAREREVVALVAQGLTNPQIARRLVIAESTAERHVSNILGKLALSRRAQLAAWAARHGLAAPPPAR
jgi:non-specific serine/threonine protein kinase